MEKSIVTIDVDDILAQWIHQFLLIYRMKLWVQCMQMITTKIGGNFYGQS